VRCRLGVGEGAVGKPQSLVDSTDHPQCEGVEILRCGAGLVAESVGEIAMARLVVKPDGLLKVVMGAGKVAEIKASDTENAVSDQGLGAIRPGRGFAQEKLCHFAHRRGFAARLMPRKKTVIGGEPLRGVFLKEIAQIGAAIGREFSYPLLRAVAGRDEPALRAALAQFEEAELLFRSGTPPDARYTFKHALVQDTAYETLLRSRRQILHRQIADALRGEFPAVAAAEPELVAHHLTQAGLDEPAIEWWGKAGDQALRRSAFKEAAAHLGKAVELADKLAATAPGVATAGNRLNLQISLGNALIWAKGHQAPETAAAFARARELASREKRSLVTANGDGEKCPFADLRIRD